MEKTLRNCNQIFERSWETFDSQILRNHGRLFSLYYGYDSRWLYVLTSKELHFLLKIVLSVKNESRGIGRDYMHPKSEKRIKRTLMLKNWVFHVNFKSLAQWAYPNPSILNKKKHEDVSKIKETLRTQNLMTLRTFQYWLEKCKWISESRTGILIQFHTTTLIQL